MKNKTIQQLHNLLEGTTGNILFLYLELNFSLEEDRSQSEAYFKLQTLWVEVAGCIVLHYPWGLEDLNLRFSLQ